MKPSRGSRPANDGRRTRSARASSNSTGSPATNRWTKTSKLMALTVRVSVDGKTPWSWPAGSAHPSACSGGAVDRPVRSTPPTSGGDRRRVDDEAVADGARGGAVVRDVDL